MCPRHTISFPLFIPLLLGALFLIFTHSIKKGGEKMKSEIFVRQLIKNLNVQDNG